VRVITGIAKGRRLRSPETARPTADSVRSSIFNILGPDCRDARVLDLFAGSGALGIEALSRGAKHATFVDNDREACRAIEENLAVTRLEGTLVRTDAERFLDGAPGEPYDLVFLDPPYERGLPFVAQILEKLAAGAWVSRGGTVVAEAPAGEIDLPAAFRQTRTRRFGQTQVTIAVNDGEAIDDA
jgi:16S rRNA (guanine966-N2)-methyltransferase